MLNTILRTFFFEKKKKKIPIGQSFIVINLTVDILDYRYYLFSAF